MAVDTGLSPVRSVTDKRRQRLAARVREHGIEGVLEAITRIGASGFCHGKGARSGWRADFDFLLQEQSLTRALEGRYDDREEDVAFINPFLQTLYDDYRAADRQPESDLPLLGATT